MEIVSQKQLAPIHQITFDDQSKVKPQNFPHSGLFIVTVDKEDMPIAKDLCWVNKSQKIQFFISPELLFSSEIADQLVTQTELLSEIKQEPQSNSMMSENNFILEFSKILLKK